MSTNPRIAILGCGAVAEFGHLPALAKLGLRPSVLIERSLPRAQSLAARYGPCDVAGDYKDALDRFDAAIVALPHHLHVPICSDLLERGKHVLVEKPMATTLQGCQALVAAAERGGACLAVGLTRRFLHAARWAKGLIHSGRLGEIQTFDLRDGGVYDWPVASSFFFKREHAGGGVLLDTGAHMLDLLLWWLGEPERFTYRDDGFGGVEADCELQLTMRSGARGTVEFSRTRYLRGTAIVSGTRGTIEVGLQRNQLRARPEALLDFQHEGIKGRSLPGQRAQSLFVPQTRNWLDWIAGRAEPVVPGSEGLRAIGLMEACYKNAQRLELPWLAPPAGVSGGPS